MKTSKLLLAAVLALASAGAASAQTVIRAVGSTAYRAPFTQAVLDLMGPGANYAYYGNSAVRKAGAAVFSGTISGNSVVVETYWTGSLSGCVDLAAQNVLKNDFLSPSNITSTSGGGNQVTTPVFDNGTSGNGVVPQVAMSDSLATSVAASVATAPGNGATYAAEIKAAALTEGGTSANAGGAGTVGVVPFEWVTGVTTGTAPDFTNISQQAALALLTSPVQVSFLTNSAADNTKYILLVGRNEDSGTRIAGLAEPQFGFGGAPIQFALTFSGSTITTQSDGRQTGGAAATVTGADAWPSSAPLNTEPTINWQTSGHSGYIAGGDVANVLLAANPVTATQTAPTAGQVYVPSSTFSPNPLYAPTAFYFVAYMGIADAQSVVAATGAKGYALSYNGVPYSVQNVEDGEYSFWSYEHLYYEGTRGSAPLTGVAKTTADAIADKIYITDAAVDSSGSLNQADAAGIVISGMAVNRSVEGGVISSN